MDAENIPAKNGVDAVSPVAGAKVPRAGT